MNLRYFLGAIICIPLLPAIYFQGKRVRSSIPDLPEASGKEGYVSKGFNKEIKILALGESTIAGVGVATHEDGFVGTLAKELSIRMNVNVHWKVYAQSGFTAKQVKQELVPKIKEQEADLIVIGLGGNDAFKLNNPGIWRQHIQGLINELQIKFKDTPIAFTNMPPIKYFPAFTSPMKFLFGNLGEILGQELRKLTLNQEGIYYSSERFSLDQLKKKYHPKIEHSSLFSDGVHPSKLAYEILAKDFVSFLVDSTSIKSALLKRASSRDAITTIK